MLNYKKELENASKTMILIHDPTTLIKLIVRMIVSKVEVKHTGILLHDERRDSYTLTISRGETGHKIPANFVRFGKENPLIQLFNKRDMNLLSPKRGGLVSKDIDTLIWKESVLENGHNGNKELLEAVSRQMRELEVVACIPAYFNKSLLAILLLGEKKKGVAFSQEELDFFSALASDVAMAIRNAQLFKSLEKESERNKNLLISITIALASAIEAKDTYTRGHTERVTKYALAIAHQMVANHKVHLSHKFLEDLNIAGLLHDVGKIGVPEAILLKPDRLTPHEFEIIKEHPARGAEILKPIPDFDECIKGVKYHHEHYDGTGYPEGLKGEQIPMMASIIAVADAYDAMTSDRSYRKGLGKDFAVQEIKRCCGTQFSPVPAQAFVELMEAGKV